MKKCNTRVDMIKLEKEKAYTMLLIGCAVGLYFGSYGDCFPVISLYANLAMFIIWIITFVSTSLLYLRRKKAIKAVYIDFKIEEPTKFI